MSTKVTALQSKQPAKQPVTVTMTLDKDTKNFRKYASDSPIIPTLYVHKSAKTPDTITVTVS